MRVTGPTQRRRNHAWLQMRSLEKARLAQRQQLQAGDSSDLDNSADDSADDSDNRSANRGNQPAQTLRSSAASPLASATVGAGRAARVLPTPVARGAQARRKRSARDQAARLAYLHRRDDDSDDDDGASSGNESDESNTGGAGSQTQPVRVSPSPTLARPVANPIASLVGSPVTSPIASRVASPVVNPVADLVASPPASTTVRAGLGRTARQPSNVGTSPALGVTFGAEEGAVVDVETETDGIDSGVESVTDGIESDSENESSTAPPAATSPAAAPPPLPPPALTSETATSTIQAVPPPGTTSVAVTSAAATSAVESPPPLTSSSSAKSSSAATSTRTSTSLGSSRIAPQPIVTMVPIARPSGDSNSSLDRLVTSLIGTAPARTTPSPTVPMTGNTQSGDPGAGSPSREADQKGDGLGLGTAQKNKLSGGAVAGIVIGVLVFVALVAAAAFFWRKHRRDRGLSFLPQPRFRLRDDEPRAPSVTQPLPGRVAGNSQVKTNTQIMDELMKAAYATDNGFNDMEGGYAPLSASKQHPLQQQPPLQSMISAAPQLPARQQASSFFMDEKAYAALAGPLTPRESKQKKPVMKWLDEVKTPTQPNGPEMPPTPELPPSATLPRMPAGGPGGDSRIPDPPRPAYYGRDTMTTDTTNTSVRWYG
ncbi:hypothetical protein C8A05DRAFT_38580 [Staphylotrichum tortipilum]|uniref:Uncharacterized protein n=1 Tax=Staphylotrichum tortipilum TaxID=2831512 RepID=A0AAN6RPN2_9PEZI|nr:hypothetical protein C8A05DRAFT_38580 [Staphylotrichum longicolle]